MAGAGPPVHQQLGSATLRARRWRPLLPDAFERGKDELRFGGHLRVEEPVGIAVDKDALIVCLEDRSLFPPTPNFRR